MFILMTATDLMFTTRVVLTRQLLVKSSCIQFNESQYEVTNGHGLSSGILLFYFIKKA